MPYKPGPIPTTLEGLIRYVDEELNRIESRIIQQQVTIKEVSYAEPDKPRQGMTVYADGTSWNPGSGEGFYYYDSNSGWQYMGSKDPYLEIAAGRTPNTFSVNKFGRTNNADNGVVTDVWDGANDVTATWRAPTAARTMKLWSSDNADKTASVGASYIQMYGLQNWSASAETSEVITMGGSATVASQNQYVIVHRMKCLISASSGINVGIIKCEASGDNNIIAQINAAEGQTQMAIYGVSSRMTAYMTQYYVSLNKAVKAAGLDVKLLVNPNPEQDTDEWQIKHTKGLIGDGTSDGIHPFKPYFKTTGPAIFKINVTSDTNDTAVDAGFDLIIET